MTRAGPDPASRPVSATDGVRTTRSHRRRRASVEGNARLTGLAAAVLFVLLAAEGVTVLKVHSLLTPHVVIGMVLVPVVLVKMGSTLWRFARYYLGEPTYRRKGPPPALLRLLGPFVVVLTVAVLATGILLLYVPTSSRSSWLFLHKATFVLWFGAMALHVLGHLLDTARLAPRDFVRHTRHQVRGASARQWLLVVALTIGVLLAVVVAPRVGDWRLPGTSATAAGAASAAGPPTSAPPASNASTTTTTPVRRASAVALGAPSALTPFTSPPPAGSGSWTPVGRRVDGVAAVYETSLVPPGGTQAAGIAWMDTRLLAARLYSGSQSPGGGPYQFTAPVEPAQAATLVAAFNGGFLMKDAGGGYYTEGKTVAPLVNGAASLVIDADGSVTVGAWGSDVTMGPNVVAVRQNLVPLVAGGQPTAQAASSDWQSWGNTCGVSSCASSVPGVENQWRSGVGVRADGALVYAEGPGLSPLQLAQLLARAGAQRAMELDINPYWPAFATYDPPAGTPASAANGTSLQPVSVQGPATFFDPAWARDFVTMSVRPSFATG